MVDIRGLDKAKVLHALYHHSKLQGLGFLHKRHELSLDACKELVDFWWLPDPTKEALADKLVGLISQQTDLVGRQVDNASKAERLLEELTNSTTEGEFLDIWDRCIKEIPQDRKLYFDYLFGRVIKVDLSGNWFDERLYDRDNGIGAAQAAVNSVRRGK